MKTRLNPTFALVCTLCVLLGIGTANADVPSLLQRVPGDANTLVIVDMEKALASPKAKAEGWKDKLDEAFAAGLPSLPPNVLRAVLASELHLDTFQPAWIAAIYELSKDADVLRAERDYKGTKDTVEGLTCLALPNGAYLVLFEPRVVGALAPANRQALAKWIREVKTSNAPRLSEFLAKAAKPMESNADIIMAIDSTDALPPEAIKARIGSAESLANSKVDMDQLATMLAGMKGIAAEVDITTEAKGKVSVSFSSDAGLLKPFGKPLLIEALNNRGAAIDEFESWPSSIRGDDLVMEGTLGRSGLRRILSFIEHPVHSLAMTSDEQAATSEEDKKTAVVNSSLKYFKSINSLMDDIHDRNRDAKTLGQVGMWMNKYADKVDALPMLNVDDELLNFGASVSARLRQSGTAVQGIGIRSAAQEAQVYQQYSGYAYGGGGVGPYGWNAGGGYYFEYNNVDAERRAIRQQEKAKGATDARSILQTIKDDTATVRRDMTQKYMVQF
jgi:hypothetical protein